MKKLLILVFTTCMALLQCTKPQLLESLSSDPTLTILESRSLEQKVHDVNIAPDNPASLVLNKYALLSGIRLTLSQGDVIYLTVRKKNMATLTDIAYQYKLANGTWSAVTHFKYKITDAARSSGVYHYVVHADSINHASTKEMRLAFVKPSAQNIYNLPLTSIIISRDDQVILENGSGDHDHLNCEQLARDIDYHNNRAAELDAIKAGCNQTAPPPPSGGGSFPLILEFGTENSDAQDLCKSVDFMIAMNDKDLADAQKKFHDLGCDKVSVSSSGDH